MIMISTEIREVTFKRILNMVVASDNNTPNAVEFREDTLHSKLNLISNSRDIGSKVSLQQIRSEKKVRVVVEAPASIANLGPGFDVLAMAIDSFKDIVELVAKLGSGKIVVKVEGFKVPEGKENVAYGVIREAINKYGLDGIDFYVKIIKGVPPALGLGSSGATSAATAYALSLALNLGLDGKELIKLAGSGEAMVAGLPHYDNVSASILGGVVLIDPESIEVLKIEPKKTFWIAIVSPDIPRSPKKTYLARKILPSNVDIRTVTKQLASIGKVIHALCMGDLELLGRAISSDYIIEPARAKLIPNYWELKKIALENGALGFNIAGAGPSVFSIYYTKEDAIRVGNLMINHLKELGIYARLHIARISKYGVRCVG